MYTNVNYKTKKDLKDAVKRGDDVKLHSPGLGAPKRNGVEFVEGPRPVHKWYATVQTENGKVISVK